MILQNSTLSLIKCIVFKNIVYLCGDKIEDNMIAIDDVKTFLNQFNIKARVFGIRFRDDRPKNREAISLSIH